MDFLGAMSAVSEEKRWRAHANHDDAKGTTRGTVKDFSCIWKSYDKM